MHRPLRLTIDRTALQHNWRWFKDRAGVPAGAAIKANGYGLGAREALMALHDAGCRTFFVSTYAEANALGGVPDDSELVVLHGPSGEDMEFALASSARPVLNSVAQVERWRQAAGGRPADAMIDTGMNRLGLRPDEAGALDGVTIDTLHSHLACADEDSAMNERQLAAFRDVAGRVQARRFSLANSAGVCLGRDYSFDLVRPGLGLYGGIPRHEAADELRQVARIAAQVVQRRVILKGESCGYGATFVADADTEAAIVNIGYADGYLRGFSSRGTAFAGEFALPVIGRVSMDLVALNCGSAPQLGDGDWVELDYDLPTASQASGLSQYELLTTLGARFERTWA
ncbi:alanine racemase [Sphingomonas sabuli]|uniref:alanine racemase n=1 Tax=Sphingomonas sabuli TaxID=2764186 RepID=A0A7G9L4V1_9SPHN|nr:alanine racemase [Sphingomonas sabuli]QNM83650.1 alanine racemase [Sphingomonas sabuli]